MFVNKLIILPSLSVEKELHSSDSTVQECEEILKNLSQWYHTACERPLTQSKTEITTWLDNYVTVAT